MNALGDSRLEGGLAILGPDHTALIKALDKTFTRWAVDAGAREICPPPLYAVKDLEKFDVYVNFPHLSLMAGPLRVDSGLGPDGGRFRPEQLASVHLGLPTATCFGAYLFFEDRQVPTSTLVTLVNRCFRGEDHFDGLRRLLSFQMREIVALGSYAHTQDVLTRFAAKIETFCRALSLEFVKEAATDPFFERGGSRALLQQVQAVKHEFQVGDLAIASVNTHRNFFGERCRITTGSDDGLAFTSCVAFGLERWVSVLVDRHGSAEQALEEVRRAASQLQPV
ncbi:MAG: hypothetical protein ACRDSP_03080 [Pseudonocardiaceae bacterium]